MKRSLRSLLASTVTVLALLATAVAADARQNLRIDTEKDKKQNTIYKLVNTGDKRIRAKVEHTKHCSGVSNRQPPNVREFWLQPRDSVQLRKVWAESSCDHSFRVIEAEYY